MPPPAPAPTGAYTAYPERRSRGRRLRAPLLLGGAAVAVLAALLVRDPNQTGSWLICPFLATTGFVCPGCGSLRATHALLHGDLATAWERNPLLVLVIPMLVLVWVTAVRRAWLGVPRRWTPGPRLLMVIPVVAGLYWVLRNVPGLEFLGPGA